MVIYAAFAAVYAYAHALVRAAVYAYANVLIERK